MADTAPDPRNAAIDEALRGCALAALGEPAPQAPQEIRARILDRLDEVELTPSTLGYQAVQRLVADHPSRSPQAAYPHLLREVERSLAASVAEFTAQFFELDPPQRRERWTALWERSAFSPPLCLRLQRLAAGLDLTYPDLEGRVAGVRSLADRLRELFVLPEAHRYQRRASLLAEMARDHKTWRRAAEQLQVRHPELAALDPQFIGAARAIIAKTAAARRPRHKTQAEPSSFWKSHWYIWIFLVALSSVGRFASGPSAYKPPVYNPRSGSPTYKPPVHNPHDVNVLLRTADEITKNHQPSSQRADRPAFTPPNTFWGNLPKPQLPASTPIVPPTNLGHPRPELKPFVPPQSPPPGPVPQRGAAPPAGVKLPARLEFRPGFDPTTAFPQSAPNRP